MKTLTKKRAKAFAIDMAIATAVTGVVEVLLRKKVKNEFIHVVVTPSLVTYGLEYLQLKNSGQTIGYKQQGLKLVSEDAAPLEGCTLVKRMLYRDYISSFRYIANRKDFAQHDGAVLPHDAKTHCYVQQKND